MWLMPVLLMMMLIPLMMTVLVILIVLLMFRNSNLYRLMLFFVIVLILIIFYRWKIFFMLGWCNQFFNLLVLVQVLFNGRVILLVIKVVLLSDLVSPDQLIILLVVSPPLLAALAPGGLFTFSVVLVILRVVVGLVVGELMLVGFARVIVTIVVVVATKLIETIRIELEAVRIVEALVVREDVETELIIIAAFDLLELVDHL